MKKMARSALCDHIMTSRQRPVLERGIPSALRAIPETIKIRRSFPRCWRAATLSWEGFVWGLGVTP